MEPLPRFAGVKVSHVIVVNERVTVCLEYRLNGEKTAYTGLAQWIEHLATNQGFVGVRLPYPVPTERARAESVFFIFIAFYFDFILTDLSVIYCNNARRRISMETMNIILPDD